MLIYKIALIRVVNDRRQREQQHDTEASISASNILPESYAQHQEAHTWIHQRTLMLMLLNLEGLAPNNTAKARAQEKKIAMLLIIIDWQDMAQKDITMTDIILTDKILTDMILINMTKDLIKG